MSAVNSDGYIHIGGNIRNIYILLLIVRCNQSDVMGQKEPEIYKHPSE